jgi:hypothetical protein
LRKAVLDFKTARKFVIAYGETISQKGYYVGNTADKSIAIRRAVSTGPGLPLT